MLDRLLFGCEREKAEVKALVYQGIKTGTVKPLRRAIFGKDEIEKAFRYMASGKHIGKVMIKVWQFITS